MAPPARPDRGTSASPAAAHLWDGEPARRELSRWERLHVKVERTRTNLDRRRSRWGVKLRQRVPALKGVSLPWLGDGSPTRFGTGQLRGVAARRHRVFYFFVPKVGCTALKTYFMRLLLGIPLDDPAGLVGIHDLVESLAVPFDPALHGGFFRFAFVRNPWARLVSAYADKILKVEYQFWPDPDLFRHGMSFDEFVDVLVTAPRALRDPHLTPQRNFVADEHGRLCLDRLARLEDFEAEWRHICAVAGLPHARVGRANVTVKRPYQSYYTPRTRELVATLYRGDIETFGYDF